MPEDVEVQQEQAESAAKAEETEQTAESAAAETSETQIDQSAEEARQRGGVQQRINELTKARRLAEAEARFLAEARSRAEAEVQFWRAKAGEPEKPAVEKPKTKPNPADFDTTEAYLDAREAWLMEESERRANARIEQAKKELEQAYTQRSEQESLAAEWGESEAEAQEAHADYRDVTASAVETLQSTKGPATPAIAHAIQQSEMGPELLYYLGKHPEEVEGLSQLHPTRAVIALGRIEARLAQTDKGEESPPPHPKAPKPLTPIRKPSGGTALDPDNPADAEKMSAEEWAKAREAKLRGR